jgi:hypothetical protein
MESRRTDSSAAGKHCSIRERFEQTLFEGLRYASLLLQFHPWRLQKR